MIMKKKELFEDMFSKTETGKKVISNNGRSTFYTYSGQTAYTLEEVQLAYEMFIATYEYMSKFKLMKDDKKEKYISKAKEIHGDNFNYDDIEFLADNKIKVFCNRHKDYIIVDKHSHTALYLNKPIECKVCYTTGKRLDLDKFKEDCTYIWQGQYTYEKITEYTNSTMPLEISCKKHGSFFLTASNHKNNKPIGCGKCCRENYKEYMKIKKVANERAKELLDNKFK